VYVASSELELPQPLSRQRVCPSPQMREGQTRLRVRGWGSPNSDDFRKSLGHCLLCGIIQLFCTVALANLTKLVSGNTSLYLSFFLVCLVRRGELLIGEATGTISRDEYFNIYNFGNNASSKSSHIVSCPRCT